LSRQGIVDFGTSHHNSGEGGGGGGGGQSPKGQESTLQGEKPPTPPEGEPKGRQKGAFLQRANALSVRQARLEQRANALDEREKLLQERQNQLDQRIADLLPVVVQRKEEGKQQQQDPPAQQQRRRKLLQQRQQEGYESLRNTTEQRRLAFRDMPGIRSEIQNHMATTKTATTLPSLNSQPRQESRRGSRRRRLANTRTIPDTHYHRTAPKLVATSFFREYDRFPRRCRHGTPGSIGNDKRGLSRVH
jgi:hypothetical protein